jgi:thiamine transport system substrate-binding protein
MKKIKPSGLHRISTKILFPIIILLLLAACAAPATSDEPRTLTVMTHDSFDASEEVLKEFEEQNNVKVEFLKSGDTGSALNKAILSKDKPLADVFYGVDNTFLSRALEEDIFEAYSSSLLASIPNHFNLDPQGRALPVDYADVCLNYDKAFFEAQGLRPPKELSDLTKPEYKGMLVVENPATSSPGLAFMLATVSQFGQRAFVNYWKDLVANDLLVVNDWNTAYYTEFTRAGGRRPIVVSYSSSPAYEIIYAEPPGEGTPAPKGVEPSTAAVVSDGSCFRQIEFVGILRGTKNRELAEKWVDFMLSPRFQEDMPMKMFVFPVNSQAQLSEEFQKYVVHPERPAFVSPRDIAINREAWIQAWTETVLR